MLYKQHPSWILVEWNAACDSTRECGKGRGGGGSSVVGGEGAGGDYSSWHERFLGSERGSVGHGSIRTGLVKGCLCNHEWALWPGRISFMSHKGTHVLKGGLGEIRATGGNGGTRSPCSCWWKAGPTHQERRNCRIQIRNSGAELKSLTLAHAALCIRVYYLLCCLFFSVRWQLWS